MQVGLMGIGLMGLPMADRLISQGISLSVHNRTIAKVAPLRSRGVAIADIPQALIQSRDCIILILKRAIALGLADADYSALFEALSSTDAL